VNHSRLSIASTQPTSSRLDRRKAQTRQALIDAAISLIGAGRAEHASIQEITDTADVGFGSFYNHFESKQALFQTARIEMLERWGQAIDRACAGVTDPAEVVAASVRITGRLCSSQPELAQFLIGAGLDILDVPFGLAPRARRDLEAGQAAGHFDVANTEIALSAMTGGILALLRLRLRDPRSVTEALIDQWAEATLRMLGVGATEAAHIAALPLPDAQLASGVAAYGM
jgi:AcrR family transcriptional regulator